MTVTSIGISLTLTPETNIIHSFHTVQINKQDKKKTMIKCVYVLSQMTSSKARIIYKQYTFYTRIS